MSTRATDPDRAATHVLVLPGGGYATHAAHEAEPVQLWLEGLGYTASVLRYPLHRPHPGPLDAVREAIVARRSDGASRVGVIGFSAGGHLAGHVALAPGSRPGQRPDFAILCYAITSMELATYHQAQEILLGTDASPAQRWATSLDRLVHSDSPPMFLWHTAEDRYVHAEHSYRLAAALAAAGRPHALHVFEHGPHSLGLADRGDAGAAAQWRLLAADWLSEISDG
jgi:acetyl esterase/lipase